MSIIPVTPDPVGDAIERINECGVRIASCLSEQLTRCIESAAPINATFWSDPRIGPGGVALLQKLSAHITLLATHFPDSMNSVLAGAGSTLTPNADGTVTHTPAEPTPEE